MSEPALFSARRLRVVAAFIVTPLVAAFLLACVSPAYDGLPSLADRVLRTTFIYALVGAYPSAFFLGVPAYLFLRDRVKASALNCAAAGAFVASLPWLFLGVFVVPDYAYSNGHVTHQNGMMTWWGWVDLLTSVGEIAALGAAAGVLFWLIAAAGTTDAPRMARIGTKAS